MICEFCKKQFNDDLVLMDHIKRYELNSNKSYDFKRRVLSAFISNNKDKLNMDFYTYIIGNYSRNYLCVFPKRIRTSYEIYKTLILKNPSYMKKIIPYDKSYIMLFGIEFNNFSSIKITNKIIANESFINAVHDMITNNYKTALCKKLFKKNPNIIYYINKDNIPNYNKIIYIFIDEIEYPFNYIDIYLLKPHNMINLKQKIKQKIIYHLTSLSYIDLINVMNKFSILLDINYYKGFNLKTISVNLALNLIQHDKAFIHKFPDYIFNNVLFVEKSLCRIDYKSEEYHSIIMRHPIIIKILLKYGIFNHDELLFENYHLSETVGKIDGIYNTDRYIFHDLISIMN